MTREEVLERSKCVFKTASGDLTTFCWDCDTNFAAVEMPCLKHCATNEERAERTKRYGALIAGRDWRAP